MAGQEKFYPSSGNIGKPCISWNTDGRFFGCNFPNAKLEGRTSCEGIIDDVCVFIRTGKPAQGLTEEQRIELKTRVPSTGQKPYIPAGEI